MDLLVWVKVVPGEAGGKCLSSTAVVWSSLQHVSSMGLYLSSISVAQEVPYADHSLRLVPNTESAVFTHDPKKKRTKKKNEAGKRQESKIVVCFRLIGCIYRVYTRHVLYEVHTGTGPGIARGILWGTGASPRKNVERSNQGRAANTNLAILV